MCFGEGGSDTLHPIEQVFLKEAARREFPTYAFRLHRNDDEMTWVVLEPGQASARTPRFTICRIDPSVMVMVEDRAANRRFCSVPGVSEAVAFALEVTRLGARAADNRHEGHATVQ